MLQRFEVTRLKQYISAVYITTIFAGIGAFLHLLGVCLFHFTGDGVCDPTLAHGAIIGAFFCIGFYLGKGVAIAEYSETYPPKVAKKWYRGFYIKDWSASNIDNLYSIIPSIILAIIAIMASYL